MNTDHLRPELLAAQIGDIPYQMPEAMLPIADCERCWYRLAADGGHCYMFRERPGERCGQFKPIASYRNEARRRKDA